MRVPARLLVLQLLPLLVFLAVDTAVQDPLWAIGAALVFVVFQTALTYARQRRLDPFIIVDALLIGGMGAVSLLTKNELFFKLKPAILEGVMVPLLLLLALARERIILGYLGRYSPGEATISPAILPVMRRMLGVMAALVSAHAGLVVLAALQWSRQTWALVSGPGFYLMLVPLLGWTLVQRLRSRRSRDPDPAPAPRRTRIRHRE